jgi:S-adenosylmethionine uptake transporter
MTLMVIAMLMLPSIDAIAKYLADTVGAGQVTWCRFFFQTLLMLPLALRVRDNLNMPNLWVHAARGALLAIATCLFFFALKVLPIADAISIFFVEPLLLTALSAVFLGEKVGWRRVSAVAIGLCGSALVIQPNFSSVGTTAFLPLGTAACFAVYLLLTRKYAGSEDPATMQFFAGVFGCAVVSVILLVGEQLEIPGMRPMAPTLSEWGWLFALGAIATLGHLLVVQAFALANASLLAPFQYLELVSATILGYLLFADFPDTGTWIGVVIIVASGLYVFHRERVVTRSARTNNA